MYIYIYIYIFIYIHIFIYRYTFTSHLSLKVSLNPITVGSKPVQGIPRLWLSAGLPVTLPNAPEAWQKYGKGTFNKFDNTCELTQYLHNI